MARREEAKEERRRTILLAARELIEGAGQASFSMRALSERAGVAITTPYNLFGSKQAIMQRLLDDDIQRYADTLQHSSADELQIFFLAVTQGVRAFDADAAYYRAVMAAVYQEGGRQYRSTFRGPRRAFWRGLVENAIRSGHLSKDIAVEPFAVNLAAIFFSHILEWVADEIGLDELEDRTHYGFALAMLGLVGSRYRAAIHGIALDAQGRLQGRLERHGPVESALPPLNR